MEGGGGARVTLERLRGMLAAVTLNRPFLLLLREDVSSLSPIGMPATEAAFVPSTTARSAMMSNSSGCVGSGP